MKLFLPILVLVPLVAAEQHYRNEPDPATMTTYYFGLLRRGAASTGEQTPETERLQKAHLANITRLAESGKLVAAGPLTDGGELRGIFIFQVASLEEAKTLSDTDPAVAAGRLAIEIHPWYAPKGIGSKYAAWRKDNPQAQVKMVTYQLGLLRRGPKWSAESTRAPMEDHLAHIARLMASGKLPAAGPFTDGGELRGVCVFRSGSLDEAKRLADEDPAVRAGQHAVELHPWFAAEGAMP